MKQIFADNDNEAARRFDIYKRKDPFKSIYPALLSSADISNYVAATGMIYPFELDNLKSGSYEIPLEGKIYYWNGKNEDCSQDIGPGLTFELQKNSIAFVNLDTNFRIPDYIALRFNLRITYVHRGLLLGTGPLIDPGFEGRLLIPLHNLTANNYTLQGGKGFIWVEFTKMNIIDEWLVDQDLEPKQGKYVCFPESKKWKDAAYYFTKAAGVGKNIRSSIPEVIEASANSASESASSAGEAKLKADINFWITIVSIALILLGAALGIPQIMSIIDTNSKIINDTNVELKNRIEVLEMKIRQYEKQKDLTLPKR